MNKKIDDFIYTRDVDYGDIINALTKRFGEEKTEQEYFYFFEDCECYHNLRDVKSYEEAEEIVIDLYALECMSYDDGE